MGITHNLTACAQNQPKTNYNPERWNFNVVCQRSCPTKGVEGISLPQIPLPPLVKPDCRTFFFFYWLLFIFFLFIEIDQFIFF